MANGVDSVVKLAEQLKAPVCNTYLHNDSFPTSHELWMGPLGYQVKICFDLNNIPMFLENIANH